MVQQHIVEDMFDSFYNPTVSDFQLIRKIRRTMKSEARRGREHRDLRHLFYRQALDHRAKMFSETQTKHNAGATNQ